MACATPLGNTPEDYWAGLLEGRSGVGPITTFDASRYPVRIAAEVKQPLPGARTPAADTPRQTGFALACGVAAARSAGLAGGGIDPPRLGVSLGCGEAFEAFNPLLESLARACDASGFHAERFLPAALRALPIEAEREYEPHTAASRLAGLVGAHGPNRNCVSACSSGTQAIGDAMKMIRRDQADAVLAGAAHSTINPLGLTGFLRLSTLSNRNDPPHEAYRPFDRDRDGFVIGEGGAVLVLEELAHARRRGAEVLAELTGFGSAQDAYRVTDAHPEGRGIVAAVSRALADARLAPAELSYINAHGSGTPLNDRVETAALKRVLGPHAYRVPVSSTKSMVGHATTACGALELTACVMAVRHGAVPPTINYHTPDPDCDLDYVPGYARDHACRHVVSENLGFGGQAGALVVSRFEG